MTALLAACNVSKRFGGGDGLLRPAAPVVEALVDVDIELSPGRTLGVIGESGSGKTTLARLLLLLDRPSQGEILFEGTPAARLTAAKRREFRRRIQPVFQNPYAALNPRMSVGDLIAEPLACTHTATLKERRERVASALVRVGLEAGDARRFPGEFSGGQRQRIAIARALASQPDLLILDEPVSSQDLSVRAAILNLLKDLQEETGMGVLLITHDLSTLRYMCEEVAVMHKGRIIERGPAEAVCRAPQAAYTRELFASVLSL